MRVVVTTSLDDAPAFEALEAFLPPRLRAPKSEPDADDAGAPAEAGAEAGAEAEEASPDEAEAETSPPDPEPSKLDAARRAWDEAYGAAEAGTVAA